MEFCIQQIYMEHDQMKCDIFAESFPTVSCLVIPLQLELHREVIKQGFMRQLRMSLFGNHRIQKTEEGTDILWTTVESAILGKNTPHGDDLRVFSPFAGGFGGWTHALDAKLFSTAQIQERDEG